MNVAYRKISAIPLALFAVIFKTIYHLACAILLGLRDVIKRKGFGFKANIYKIGCDFQEAAGYFISLFNDKKGTYFIQKSIFNKACCDMFLKTPVSQQLQIKRILEKPVTSTIPEDVAVPFVPKIVPKIAPIVNVIVEPPKNEGPSPFRDMSETEIQELTIEQVGTILPHEVEEIRAQCLSTTRNIDFDQIKKPEDISFLPIGQLCHLTGEEIDFCLFNIPTNLRVLLAEDQVKRLKQIRRKKIVDQTSKEISLIDYRDKKSFYKDLVNLDAALDEIGVNRFEKWLASASDTTLQKYTLNDLLEFPNSSLKDEFLEKEPKVAVTPKRSSNNVQHLVIPKHRGRSLSDVPEEVEEDS